MDVARHNQLIEQLIPLTFKSNFSEIFKSLTQGETANARFLLKMELNRLIAPTRRLIDLRGKVDGDCQPYEHDGLVHHLDDVAVRTFEAQLKLYKGHYTMGIFEAMMHTENNFRVIGDKKWAAQQQEAKKPGKASSAPAVAEKKKDPVKTIKFGNYQSRREERMHLSIPIHLVLDDGRILEATSSDISASGLKIKVAADNQLPNETELLIKFTGFEQEFASAALKQGIGYRIIGAEHKEQQHWLKLVRTRENNEFDSFIKAFIKGNRLRYKVNIDNVEETVLTKGFEQHYLGHCNALPLFFGGDNGLTLRHLLKTDNNQSLIEQWRDDVRHSYLGRFFTPALMKTLIKQPGKIKETLIFTFSLVRDTQLRFYAATREQLAVHGVTGLFLSYAARKPSWRVYKFQLAAADISDTEHQSVLPLGDKFLISPVTFERLAPLHWVGSLRDITDETTAATYQQWPIDSNDIQQLRNFAITSHPDAVDMVPYNFVQQRREQRFSYRTEVSVTTPVGQIDGTTVDFSCHGLQLKLKQSLSDAELGQQVYVKLPTLQKISKTIALAQLPYEIVGHNATKTVLHLKVPEHIREHGGQQFFTLLIKQNIDKLRSAQDPNHPLGTDLALRNAYLAHLMSNPVFLHKRGRALALDAVGTGSYATPLEALLRMCSPNNSYQLYPLFKSPLQKRLVEEPIRTLTPKSPALVQRLYIHISDDAQLAAKLRIDTRLDSDFADEQERQQFSRFAAENGELMVLQLELARSGRPDMDYLANELKYIGQFASHKAKQLEEELWSIEGIIDVIDVSDEAYFRYRLSRPSAG